MIRGCRSKDLPKTRKPPRSFCYRWEGSWNILPQGELKASYKAGLDLEMRGFHVRVMES